MRKKLITLLLSGILGIIPVGSVFAEELSSGEEVTVVMEETADPDSGAEVLSEEVTAPQEDNSTADEILEIEKPAPEDVLSAGEADGDLLDDGEEIPAAGATYSGTWGTCKWDIDSEGVLTIHAGTGESEYYGFSVLDQYKDHIYSIVAEKDVIFPQNSGALFSKLENCKTIDLSQADTSNMTDMYYMFAGCSSLTSLDISNFDTSNVKTMREMFFECESLTSLDLSNFDTSNVKDMGRMFSDCPCLTNLDLSNFDTSSVTDMWKMFNGCESLACLDLSNFDTSKVWNMGGMFAGCYNLTGLDLSNFNTSKVTDMDNMFKDCSSLTSLDLSTFDTLTTRYMESIFEGCYNLSEIKVGLKFSFKGNGSSEPYLPNKLWQSTVTSKAYSSAEIIETRNNIADAYYAVDLPQPKLVAAYNGAKGIGLKFYKVDNAKEYVLYRKFDGCWHYVRTFSAADPSLQIDRNKIMYTDTSVAKNYGNGYIYSVAAKNGSFESTYDTKGAAIYRLTPPTLTKISNSSAETATVSWKRVFGKTETNGAYDLQIAEYGGDGKTGPFKSITTLPGYNNLTLKTTVSGLKKNGWYVFRIRCAKTNKDRGTYYSEYSPWLSVTITK